MNKNGLTSRDREKKVGSWVFYVSGFFFISFFVAPMLVGTGEVPPLEARANAFDYATSDCLLYTSPSPRDSQNSRMPSSA